MIEMPHQWKFKFYTHPLCTAGLGCTISPLAAYYRRAMVKVMPLHSIWHTPAGWDQSFSSQSVPSLTLGWRRKRRHLVITQPRWNPSSLTGLCWQDWSHSFYSGVYWGKWLLSKSFVLLGCLFPVFWLKRIGFFWGCCSCLPIGISKLLASLVWDTSVKKKTQGTHHCIIPWVPRSLASLFSSLHLLESSYMFYM